MGVNFEVQAAVILYETLNRLILTGDCWSSEKFPLATLVVGYVRFYIFLNDCSRNRIWDLLNFWVCLNLFWVSAVRVLVSWHSWLSGLNRNKVCFCCLTGVKCTCLTAWRRSIVPIDYECTIQRGNFFKINSVFFYYICHAKTENSSFLIGNVKVTKRCWNPVVLNKEKDLFLGCVHKRKGVG